ncbi:MAG: NAD-dependent epimerase/dehydratase family protein [Thermomicrobiales bacterium]
MAEERFLVTGALGCIGAWVTKRLTDEGVSVWTYDLPGTPHRLRLIMEDDALATVNMVEGDITDQERFERTVVEQGITHIVHLAALQVPFVRANPVQGARVNVVGSTIVLETAKRHAAQVRNVVYASSIAVYGPVERYPPGPLQHDAPLLPTTLYGVTKQDNEGTAKVYWQDYQTRSIGLRPFFVYGPGRDQGISATPTKAMLAAAVGRPYHFTFASAATYQHADDVAKTFIQAARATVDGAPVFNLGGTVANSDDVVAAIEEVAPEMAGRITHGADVMPFPAEIDGQPLEEATGAIGWRPFRDGVRQTIQDFRAAVEAGRLDVEAAIA